MHPHVVAVEARSVRRRAGAASGLRVELTRLSLADCELALDGVERLQPLEPLELGLRYEDHPIIHLHGRVRRVAAEGRIVEIDHTLSLPTARAVARMLDELAANHQSIPASTRAQVFDERAGSERLVRLLRALVATYPTTLRSRDETRAIGAPWIDEPWPSAAFAVDVETPYGQYCFEVSAQRQGRERSVRLLRLERRLSASVPAPPSVVARIRHPLWPSLIVERPVRRIAVDELGVTLDAVDDLLDPGLRLDDVEVVWKGGSARLRGWLSELATPTSLARISLDTAPTSEWSRWERQVTRLAHPSTFVGEADLDELWDLYRDSGYFQLSDKNARAFADQRRAFQRASEALASRPSIGAQVTWESRDGVEATISMLRPWSTAWLVYQLGRRRERPLRLSGNRVLYDLYVRAYEHAGRDPDLRWHVAYVQVEGARFSRMLHRDFVAQHVDRGLAAIVPFRALEIGCQRAPVAPPGVVVASAPERERMLEALASLRPGPYVEALDLVPARLDLEIAARELRTAGLARSREVIVVRRDGKARAAAVLDLAEEGLHVFGLLDVARVVPLEADFGDADLEALLAGAAAWYRLHGKKRFLYFDELGRGAPGARAQDLGAADQTVMSADLVPDLLEEVLMTTVSGV